MIGSWKVSLRHLVPALALFATADLSVAADAGKLPAQVSSALAAAKIPASAFSLAVIPLEGQGMAQFVNADQAVNPASTMKLVTTYAALELLGPTYQWRSEFYGTGPIRDGKLQGDLVFRGDADPKLTMERVWLMLRDLRAAGVHEVTGDLVLQPGDLRLPVDLPAFRDDGNDPSRPFLVAPDPLLTNLKLFNLKTYGEAGGVRVHLDPALPELNIDNQVKLLPPVKSCPWPNVTYGLTDNGTHAQMRLTGAIHQGCSAERYLSALNAETYTASLIRTLWHEMGGRIAGANRIDKAPAGAKLLARSTSPDLVTVVREINKFSNNTMARQLFLTIGREQRSPVDADDHKAATRIINQWLADKGIAPEALVMENGSGLSRSERLTAREMAQLLEAAWNSPYSSEFIASMPLAAMDGTMRKRLRNTPVAGRAHIKTGSLSAVRAIAGITQDANGQSWAVTAIVNHPAAGGSRHALDLVLQDVYRRAPTDIATKQ
ncbi:D-alanyl-D-alanine carboxypeptidase / D-alanyl-D-alanine-endopeptidase (penicillin-binding protein 4) [Halopseudomonas xinjiangensis]|uniref:D-alanyl-D-alanine carboxypeptidase / D-alanyl-D-alanine-endopeptidase (Penicillin-binding protein 4) n=1 Tax=Halopseudomonas xinjiangensis TaxID=487184 RepID=A0A1H1S5V7_9GAMM|nr:D-alanyl-D-alanine carboxypeptidase/D-alanyl-D-alanine-endopeptidase [Halopseudomonas xinjiangensis]SDS42639.1 D-alanyl-D-alanine carboxypeptidase / D-alanyl-D-alanine-endopeptidase (penicillin-binding protein 4) [Halopseudomonas xinjiangensis]